MADMTPGRLTAEHRSARPGPEGDDRFAAPAAVRRALFTYAADSHLVQSAAADAIRSGVALSLVLAALARRLLGSTGAPWVRSVPTSRSALEAMTGITGRGLTTTLEQLAEAGLARVEADSAGLLVTLGEVAWGPHPLLAAMPWEQVVSALHAADAPVTASLVVLAELVVLTEEQARLTSPLVPGALPLPGPTAATDTLTAAPLAVTCKALAGRTSYSLSRVDQALAGLERAGCVGRVVRRGSTGATHLRPWVIGIGEPRVDPIVASVERAPMERATGSQGASPTVVQAGGADAVVMEIGGVRMLLAPGDTLDLTGRDADGRRVLRLDVDGVPIVIRPPAKG